MSPEVAIWRAHAAFVASWREACSSAALALRSSFATPIPVATLPAGTGAAAAHAGAHADA